MEIAVILPVKEGFSNKKFGALSLCVKEHINHSKFKKITKVYGVDSNNTFQNIFFHNVDYKKNYNKFMESKTKAYCRELAKIFNETKPDIIEVHNRPIVSSYLKKMTYGKIPISLYIHNDPKHMLVSDIPKTRSASVQKRKRMIENNSIIYCVTDYIKNELLDGIKTKYPHVHTLHNGIDIPEIDINKKRKKQFVYVGRMTYEKGPLEFANAAMLVKNKLPDWNFVFVGRMRKRKRLLYEQETMNAIEDLGRRATYHSLMPHNKIMELFKTSEVAVLPSYWQEPFGRTVLEAMASGAAVITSGNGGLNEITGETSIRIQDHDEKDIAEQIIKIANNDEMRKKLQSKAYERAKNKFDIKSISSKLDAFRMQYIPELSI